MNKILKKAFTLIELLVVIAIIGILSGLIVVAMGGITNSANIAKSQVFSNSLRNALMLNIVGEWKFDSISGTIGSVLADGTVIADSWSTNNGTTSGGPTLKSGADCVSGQCLSFDGSNDYVDCGNDNSLNITSAITISAWIKWPASDIKEIIVKNTNANTGAGSYEFFQSSNRVIFRTIKSGTPLNLTSAATILPNNWTHIVATWDGTTKYIYINGTKDVNNQAQSSPIDATTGKLSIGAYANGNFPFSGSIDDVRIYNAAVPISQIKEQYFAGMNELLMNGSVSQTEYLKRIKNETAQN